MGGLELPDRAAFLESTPGAHMFDYRIERQQDDGSWSIQEFQSVDDSDAITYGLRIRTANRCELYRADRWLATFDGVTEASNVSAAHPSGKRNPSLVEMETEVAYFHRRALQERERGRNGASAAAKLAHFTTAKHLESLARVAEAIRRRLTFYDVNAASNTLFAPPRLARGRKGELS